jgi:hypothetical protein
MMLLDLAKAIVVEAHRAVKPIIAHPSNQEDIEIALQSGVADTTPGGGPWSSSLVARLKAAQVPLIPSLTLGHVESKNESPEEFERAMNKVVVPERRRIRQRVEGFYSAPMGTTSSNSILQSLHATDR